MTFLERSHPEFREPLVVTNELVEEHNFLTGLDIMARQVQESVAAAVEACIDYENARRAIDPARAQTAAEAIHHHCQTAQVLSWSMGKEIAKHRRRNSRVR